jgi:hypothetical protein
MRQRRCGGHQTGTYSDLTGHHADWRRSSASSALRREHRAWATAPVDFAPGTEPHSTEPTGANIPDGSMERSSMVPAATAGRRGKRKQRSCAGGDQMCRTFMAFFSALATRHLSQSPGPRSWACRSWRHWIPVGPGSSRCIPVNTAS